MTETQILSETEIDDVRSDLEEKDVIEDDEIKVYLRIRDKSSTDTIAFAKLFLRAYDFFSNNQFLFKSYKAKIQTVLNEYPEISQLREYLENYGDGCELGAEFEGQKIKELLQGKRDNMNKLVKLFFQILMEEE